MSSRKDALSRLSLVGVEPAAPAPAEAAAPAPIAPDPEPVAPAGKDRQHTSIYLPRATHERLREMAFKRRLNLNAVLLEAINDYLRAQGHGDDVVG